MITRRCIIWSNSKELSSFARHVSVPYILSLHIYYLCFLCLVTFEKQFTRTIRDCIMQWKCAVFGKWNTDSYYRPCTKNAIYVMWISKSAVQSCIIAAPSSLFTFWHRWLFFISLHRIAICKVKRTLSSESTDMPKARMTSDTALRLVLSNSKMPVCVKRG